MNDNSMEHPTEGFAFMSLESMINFENLESLP
jgi:hypothetical protein